MSTKPCNLVTGQWSLLISESLGWKFIFLLGLHTKLTLCFICCRSVGTFARALDCSSSVRQPSLHMSAAAASRDITLVRFFFFISERPLSLWGMQNIHLSINSWQRERGRWTVIVACCEADPAFVKESFSYRWSNFFWPCASYNPSSIMRQFFFQFY